MRMTFVGETLTRNVEGGASPACCRAATAPDPRARLFSQIKLERAPRPGCSAEHRLAENPRHLPVLPTLNESAERLDAAYLLLFEAWLAPIRSRQRPRSWLRDKASRGPG